MLMSSPSQPPDNYPARLYAQGNLGWRRTVQPVNSFRKSSEIQKPPSFLSRSTISAASVISPCFLASIKTPISPTTFKPRLRAADRPNRSSIKTKSAPVSLARTIASASPAPRSCLRRFTHAESVTVRRSIQLAAAMSDDPGFSPSASTTSCQTASANSN